MSLIKLKSKIKLPSHWKIVPLKTILESSQYGTSKHNSDEGTPIVGIKHIKNGRVIFKKLPLVKLSQLEEKSLLLKHGDILFNRTNSFDLVGKIGLVENPIKAVYASYLIRFIINNKYADSRFVAYWLSSSWTSRLIKIIATKAISQANINPTEFTKFCVIPLPSLKEQKTIADILATWDKADGAIASLIQLKQNFYYAFAQKLLFGHLRNNKITSERKITPFYSIPSDWKNEKIAKIAKELKYTNASVDAAVISCSKYLGFVDSLKYFKKQVYSKERSTYKIVKKWQFGYPANHIDEGSIGLLEHRDIGIVSPIYVVFEVDQQVIYPPYLYHVFKTPTFKHIFLSNTSASVKRRGSLRWKAFSSIIIPQPPMEEQKSICIILERMKDEINQLKKLHGYYLQQKKSLTNQIISGMLYKK